MRLLIVLLISLILLASCQETKIQETTPTQQETTTNATPVNETNETVTEVIEEKDIEVFIPRKTNLTLYFLDTEGDSTIIQYKNKGILADSGYEADSEKVLKSLRDLGITYLDYVFATNAQPKRIGGMPYIILRTSPSNIVENGISSSQAYKQYKDLYNDTKIIKYDETIMMGDFSIKVLVGYDEGKGFCLNLDDNSLILMVYYGNIKYLLMSDCGLECEERIMNPNIEADLIQISPNCDSSSLAFLQKVKPKVAVVSYSGEDFCPNIVERFKYLNIPLYITNEKGDIYVTTDGLNSHIDWKKS